MCIQFIIMHNKIATISHDLPGKKLHSDARRNQLGEVSINILEQHLYGFGDYL